MPRATTRGEDASLIQLSGDSDRARWANRQPARMGHSRH